MENLNLKVTIDAPELTKAILELASALKGVMSQTTPAPETKKAETTPAPEKKAVEFIKTSPAEVTPAPETVEPTETVVITLEEIRAKLGAKTREGKAEQVKAILADFGYEKLTAVHPVDYAPILKKVGAL